jgi:hypothetical protein
VPARSWREIRKFSGNPALGENMGRLARSVFPFSFVFLLSLVSFAAAPPAPPVTYNASVERVFAAEMKAFGATPTNSEKGKCQVSYQSTGRYKLLWTASCKEIGNGQVGVTLAAEGQWFFGVGDEKNRIAKIFWSNMDVILKNGATSNGAPAPSPLVAQPAPELSPLVAQPAPELSPSAPSAPTPAPLVAPRASENAAMVQISSEPSGADILVDGNYTGSTPSQLKLKSGTHSVSIIKKGFAPWERSITVESGEIRNVAAELEK